jgi:hypothetical protein
MVFSKVQNLLTGQREQDFYHRQEMTKLLGVLTTCVAIIGTANATLIDRGGGLIYDSDRHITWSQDANLAASNTFGVGGIREDGVMSWATANSWVGAMNAANYLGYQDWRLPDTLQPDATCGSKYNAGNDGVQGYGYGCTGSELGHLFYEALSGSAGSSITYGHNANYALFQNIQAAAGYYWSGTEYAPNTLNAWYFRFSDGDQGNLDKAGMVYAWAVRDGDAAAIPEPATYTLMLVGLGLFGAKIGRRK